MSNVVIKLSSKETLFATLIEATDTIVTVQDPYIIERKFTSDDKGLKSNIAFEPWCDYSIDYNASINRQHIIALEPLHPKLNELYKSMIMNITNVNVELNPISTIKTIH